jgi:hypothetical protein
MAVTSTNNRVSYTADGVQRTFAYPFEIVASGDLQVYDNGALQGSGYTVTGAGADAGGNVVFTVAPTSTHTILIVRILAITQTAQLPSNDKFPSTVVETMSDKTTMLIQQLNEVDGRSLHFALTSAFSGVALPDPVALKILQWKSDLTGIQNADMPVGAVGPTGPTGPQGPAGGGAAPTVREVDGAPSIGAITVLEFDQDDGFVVSNPVGAEARVKLGTTAIDHGGTAATTVAGARTNLAVPGLAVDNAYTGREKLAMGASLVAAATVTPGTDGNAFHITGNTTITALATLQAGTVITFVFDGAPVLTHDGTTFILQGSVNYQVAAGDVLQFISEGAGNWRELSRRTAAAAAGGGGTGITIGLYMALPINAPFL